LFSAATAVAFAGMVLAAPSPQGSMSNELINGGCKGITFIWARASTETNNMGMATSVGPSICKGLKAQFRNDVACQGVGSPQYTAGLADNVSPAGTTAKAIAEATKHYNTASTKCPRTIIVTGGYSQGTAVIFNAVQRLPESLKNKIAGVVLYGYTKNKQNRSAIKGYPAEKTKVFCPKSDGVCNGGLNVNAGHFSYLANGNIKEGYNFLAARIRAAKSGGGGSSGGDGGEDSPAPSRGKGGKGKGLGKAGGFKGKGKGGS